MPSFSYPSNKPQEPLSSHTLAGSDPFLGLSINSDLEPWVPDTERPDQAMNSCQPWNEEAFDVYTLYTRVSRASSCAGQWQDQEATHDPYPLSPLHHELPIHCVGAPELPLYDSELDAFFNNPQSPYSNNDFPSPDLQVQHSSDSNDKDDDVVFLFERKVQKDHRRTHGRTQGSRKRRSVKRIAKHTTPCTSTKWKNVALRLDEAGYHLDSGDEAFSWNRRRASWGRRSGSHFTNLPEVDPFDPQFYIKVRPNGGDGFPVEFSLNDENPNFTGFDEMNQQTVLLDVSRILDLLCPEKG